MCSFYDVVTQRSFPLKKLFSAYFEKKQIQIFGIFCTEIVGYPLWKIAIFYLMKSSYFCSLKRFPLYLGHQEIIFFGKKQTKKNFRYFTKSWVRPLGKLRTLAWWKDPILWLQRFVFCLEYENTLFKRILRKIN